MTSQATPDPAILEAGYRLERAVARGGMGEIWRATKIASGERVAIKRILSHEPPTPQEVARLRREVEVLSRLRHEHIVRYIDAGRDSLGYPYMVLEWLEGESLEARAQRDPPDLATSVDFIRQALAGLSACHQEGVLHRDVKLGNIFVAQTDAGPRVKLLDLGLALVSARDTRLTAVGTIMGTLHYLAPEQARGAPHLDRRTDLYSMGVALYELCTGRLPFEAEQPLAVLLKIVTETPPRPRLYNPAIPEWLQATILRAIARAPADRFASAEEMGDALARPLHPAPGGPALRRVADSLADTLVPDQRPSLLSGEHRIVSLLCVAAPDDHSLLEFAQAAIGEQRGLARRLLGDVVVGLFGVTETQGDEARRCIAAGLSVRAAARTEARLLAATIRVEVGEGLHMQSEALDRALEHLGTVPPNQVIVDRATQRLAGSSFLTSSVGEFASVVGVAEAPAEGWRVLGVNTPLIGREPELATLRAALDRASEDREAGVGLVVGPAGIGKTRLVSELLAGARDRSVLLLEARADASLRRAPAGLLAGALARAAGIRTGMPSPEQWAALQEFVQVQAPELQEEERHFLGAGLGLVPPDVPAVRAARADPKLMQERVARALEGLLVGATRRGLVTVWLDDLHWETDHALTLLERLLETLEDQPLFLVATTRGDLIERRPRLLDELRPTRLDLRPLRKRDVRRLAAAILQGEVAPSLQATILEWSAGNPHLVEEFLAWLVAHEAIVAEPGGWAFVRDPSTLDLPVAVEAALQGRIDRLGSERKELLKIASVLGGSFWTGALARMGAAVDGLSLSTLCDLDFITSEPSPRFVGTEEWTFRHSTVQRVAYGMLPALRRRELHAGAASWLEEHGESDALALAKHFARAELGARARDWYARAAEQALAEGDAEVAAQHFETALEGEVDDIARIERTVGSASALIALARYEEVLTSTEPLLRLAAVTQSAHWRASISWLRGRALRGLGRTQEAVDVLRHARGLLASQPRSDLRFDVEHSLFWALWYLGDYTAVAAVGAAMRELAGELGRPDQLSATELASASFHLVHGDLAASVESATCAVACAREVQHAFRETDSLLILGSIQAIVGELEAADEALDQAQHVADRLRVPYYAAHIAAARGYVALVRRESCVARTHYEVALGSARAAGDRRAEATASAGLARAVLGCDADEADLQRASELVVAAIDLAGEGQAIAAEGRLAGMEVCLAKGDRTGAAEHARAALVLLETLGTQEQFEVELLLAACDALEAVGAREEARAAAKSARRRLLERAGRITDAGVRERFLAVPHNRRALEERPSDGG